MRDLVRGKRQWAHPLGPEARKCGFMGWHENGYLPHRDEPGLVQFVTFRLADAFPEPLRAEWETLLRLEDNRRRHFELERYLDRGRGACWLRRPELAAMVQESLLFRHGSHYELRAWVVMPNHVHLLFRVTETPMWQLVDAWKGFTAKQANRMLGLKGTFWQEGYWDTYMRDDEHERKARHYIEDNPVKAGLVVFPRDWPWTSARFRDDYERLTLPAGCARPRAQQQLKVPKP